MNDKRSIWVYALALAAALVWAYGAWTSDEQPDDGESVEILGGKQDTLTRVAYSSENLDVSISMMEDERGRYGWARVEPKNSVPSVEDPDSPIGQGKPEEFKVGGGGDKVLEGVAPFRAKRILEGVQDAQLEELGLAPPEATLTIEREGREAKTYELSSKGFGGVNVYVRDPDNGTIYIVDAKVLTPLKTASRTLPDRALHDVDPKDIESVVVSDGTREARWDQLNADDPNAAYWAADGEGLGNDAAKAWLDKALNLKVARYLQADETPSDAAAVFTYTVKARDGHTTAIEVLRGYDEAGEDVFFAKSAHNRGLVKLHRSLAAEAAADLESALTGEAPPPREDPAVPDPVAPLP
jgi:hypothetical protein